MSTESWLPNRAATRSIILTRRDAYQMVIKARQKTDKLYDIGTRDPTEDLAAAAVIFFRTTVLYLSEHV